MLQVIRHIINTTAPSKILLTTSAKVAKALPHTFYLAKNPHQDRKIILKKLVKYINLY
jgi:hypothetical protein